MTPQTEARVRAAVDQLVAAILEAVEPAPAGPPRLLTIPQSAERLGVARSTVYELLGSGELPSIKVRGRRLVAESAITDYIASRSA